MNLILHSIRSKFSDVSHVSTETLAEWLKSSKDGCSSEENDSRKESVKFDLFLLDARPEEEYSISHIDGAIRMEHDADEATISNFVRDTLKVARAVGELVAERKAVVCYCSLGYRSSMLARLLKREIIAHNLEVVKVYNLDGSLFRWANENRPMVSGDGAPTIYAHPYNVAFGVTLRKELRKYK